MRKILLFIATVLLSSSVFAQTASQSYTAPSSVTVDGCGTYCEALPSVSFSPSDFGSGCIISDVDVIIEWAKTDGTCSVPGIGSSFHGETNFRIDGPPANVILAVPNTWGGGATISSVVTRFNQGSTIPSGTPVSGTFGPNGGNLNTFNGSSAFGNWNLAAGDNASGDPLCLTYYEVIVTTAADNTGPVISGAGNQTINTSGSCGAIATYSVLASDNCQVNGAVSVNPASGSFFNVGATTVNYSASDIYSNTTNGSFTITVVDDEDPVITCPGNISTVAAVNTCGAVINYTVPTATDNCSAVVTRIAGPASGSNFAAGPAVTVTHRATDPYGNTADCSFTVTVTDNQPPVITCPANITVDNDNGVCGSVQTYLGTATDNCPGQTVSTLTGPASGATFPIGSTTVTLRATDASSNTADCSFTVTVTDAELPVISGCPTDISIDNDPGNCSAVVNWSAPTATDNCLGVSITRTTGQDPNTTFALGTVTVTYVAADVNGNSANCQFDVTVNDTENPSISCESNMSVNNSSGLCGATVSFADASFGDNCPGVTLTQTTGASSGSFFSVGTQTITFVATDGASNTATCSFTVTVVDNEAPQFLNCPADIEVNTTSGICEATVSYATLLANDNCDGTVSPVQTVGLGSGSDFPLGVTTETYTATDGASNVGTCTFTVTVLDVEAPQINCPSNQTVTFDGSCQYELLDYTSAVGFLSDNCTASPILVQSPVATTIISGASEISITATDASNNSTTCTFFVNPNDVVDPTITCPSNQDVSVNAICQFTLPDYTTTTANDDCDPSPVVTQLPAVGAILTNSTPVTLTVTDASGNDASCTFNANPLDDTNPTIVCPADQLETVNASCEFDIIDYTGLGVADDNCDASPIVTQDVLVGTTVTASTVIMLTATDADSNTGTCTFNVIPEDNTNPTVSCPNDIPVSFNALCQFTVLDYTSMPTVGDDCDSNPTVSQIPVAGTSIGGTTTINITVEDAAGNTATCSFDVVPSDNAAPSIACPATQLVDVDGSCETSLADYTGMATTSDNCDATPTVTQSPSAGTTVPGAGTSETVTLTSTDADSNASSCTFAVVNNDATAPTISCAGNLNVSFDADCEYTVGNYVGTPTVGDNCGTPIVTQSPALGTVITGTTVITLTATDGSNNTATCTFSIIPDDNEVPTISCPANQDVDFDAGCEFTLADYTGMATASDNCDLTVTVTQSPAVGSTITTGATITLTAEDDGANTNTCTFSVIPSDNTSPTINCPADQSESFSVSCNFVLPDYTGLSTTNDNCDNTVTVTQSPTATAIITGSQVITLTATDDDSNTSTCTFNVLPDDNTDPTITCPADQDVSFNAQCAYNLMDYTSMGTAVDNCDTDPVITQSPTSGTSIGTTTIITLTATDDNGNTATCMFDVIPADNTDPIVSCPGDQNVSFDGACEYDLLDYTGMANTDDNCDASPTVTQSPAVGFTITTTQTVTITATDADSNSGTCTFDVIPVDNTNPTITCPSDELVDFDASCQFTLLNYTGSATSGDNCDASPVVTQNPASGDVITGTTEITLTVMDASGNLNTCAFDVIPEDNENPTITCPSDQIVSSNPSCQFTIVDYTSVGSADDNCDLSVAVTQSPAFGTIITIPTTVTLTAEDDNVNTATCTFLVTPADNDNPNITCPGDQLEDFDANCEFDIIDYTGLATATDNCSSTPVVTQDLAVSTTISGQTTITLTATDDDFNTATCTFDILPEDNTNPVVTCPANMDVSFSGLCQFVLVDYTGMGGVSDNCGTALSITQSPVLGTQIGGATAITLSSTDPAGNIGTCTFTVTPTDNAAPVLTCPSDITEAFDTNCEFILVDYTSQASVFDNCDVPPYTIGQSPAAGTAITGATTITFSVTDAASNTSTCMFQVLPNDDVPPTIACPTNQNVSFDGNCQFSMADYTSMAVATDNCDNPPAVSQSPASGLFGSNTLVTLTALDVAGNSSTCSFNVLPADDTNPNLTCPADVTVNFTSNCEFTVPDYTGAATFSDNCDNTPFITQLPSIGTIISGATTVSITVLDAAGNDSICTFSINPIDNEVPDVTCPDDMIVALSAACDYEIVDYAAMVMTDDNCDTDVALSQSPSVGLTISANTTVTFTGTDDATNSSTCTFEIVVEDQTDPTITCPTDQTVALGANCQFIVQNYIGMTTSTDNCDPSLAVTQTPLAGSLIGGSTVVTVSALDASGNIGTCTFSVLPDDIDPPTIFDCPTDITVENDLAICGAEITYGTITALDNCAGVVVPALTTGQASGTIFQFGTTTVTYVADDGNGNTTTCEFDVTVNDTEDPIILCPADIDVTAATGTCGADVAYSLPTVTDNCTNPITPSLDGGLASAANFPVGTTIVTYGADDGNGNTASCSFEVTVTDDEAPEITCPSNITVSNDPGNCDAVVTYSLPTVTDNCTSGIVPDLTAGLVSGSIFEFGTTTITYQAEDISGNTDECSFTITVEDNENPVITCPDDVSVFVEPTTCQAIVDYDAPTVTDNCNMAIVPALQSGPASGDSFALDDTVITYTADDGNGNTATCSFTVTVIDNEVPEIACSGDQLEAFDAICELVLPDYTSLAITSDNCDGAPVVTQLPAIGSTITGVTTVTLTSTDADNNSNSCSFDVMDNTPPVVDCPSDQLVGSDINCEFTVLDYTVLTVTSDNCGTSTLTQSPIAGTLITDLTTVTVTAEDELGNTASCEFDIVVEDNIAPSITCIGNQQAFFDANCMYELPDYTGQADSEDNCDSSPVIMQSPAAGNVISGATVITLTAEDDAGNTLSCTFSVLPIDIVAPTIVCPGSQVAQFDGNCEFALDDYTGMASTDDNCSSVITVSQSPAVGDVQTLNTIVTLTAEDEGGNTTSCIFLVVPEDNIAPEIDCPLDLEVSYNENCEYALADVTGSGVVSDNCSSSLFVTQTPSVGAILNSETSVTLTVDDGNGNSADCSFNVTPVDNLPPIIVCVGDQEVVFDENCQFEISDYNGFATTDDNCSSSITVTQSPAAGTFITGPQAITLTADDGNGNTADCSFIITPDDETVPTIDCPTNQDVSFGQSCAYQLLDYTAMAVAADNCSPTVSVTQDVLPGIIVGDTITITLTAMDGNGNTAECSFDVNPSDNTDPVASCPPNVDVDFDSNCEYVLPDYKIDVVASDNCGTTNISQSPDEGAVISTVTQIVITVDDANGNSVTCSFVVNPSDNEPPSLVCPNNQEVMLDQNCQFEMPDYGAQSNALDNCTPSLVVNQFPPAGSVVINTTVITLSVEDNSGNQTECSFVIDPIDNINPVIAQCPSNQTAVLGANCELAIPDFTGLIQATDNCDQELEYLQQPLAGNIVSGVGIIDIIVAALDDEGNAAICEFELLVSDDTNPTIDCPADQLLELSASCEFVIPDYTSLAVANDACGDVTVSQSPLAGSVISGQLNATLIVEDENGNTSTCTFFVDVIELEVSVVGTEVSCNGGNDGTAIVTVTGGTSPYTEDWGGFDPNALEQGFYTVTVADANNCTVVGEVDIVDGASFEIDVTPSGAVVICQGESVVLDAGSGYAVYNWSTGASVQTISVSAEADYWVTVTNAIGCVSNTDTVSVLFTNSEIPTIIEEAGGVLYSSNDTAVSYQWYLNGNPIPGATDNSYCPSVSGNYYVQIVDSYGCTVNSFFLEHTFDPNSGCATGILEFGLRLDVYPNPSNGQFTLSYALDYQTELRFTVFDLLGERITESIFINNMQGREVLDLRNQAEGVYILRIELGSDRVLQQRLVLVK